MHGSVVVVGNSEGIRLAVKRADELGKGDSSVLIVGPEGSGRQHLARYMHSRSIRSSGPLKIVDCLSFDANNVHQRLYGRAAAVAEGVSETRPGILELAATGTLVLTELHRAPSELAQQLESVFKNGRFSRVGDDETVLSVDCVIVGTAQSRSLECHHLHHWFPPENTIELPPLNERLEDIPLLLENFLRIFNEEFGKSLGTPDVILMEKLCQIQWRRNVCDLKRLARDAVENCRSDAFLRGLISKEFIDRLPAPSDPTQSLRDCMRELVVEALHAGLPIPLLDLGCSDEQLLTSGPLHALIDGCGSGASLYIASTVRDTAKDLSERRLRQLLGLEKRRSVIAEAVVKQVINELGLSRDFATVDEVHAAYESVKDIVERKGLTATRDRMQKYLEVHIGKRVSAGCVSEVRKALGDDLKRSQRPKKIGLERGLDEAATERHSAPFQEVDDPDESNVRSEQLAKMDDEPLDSTAERYGIDDCLRRDKKIERILYAEQIRAALAGTPQTTLDTWAQDRDISLESSKEELLDKLVRAFLTEEQQKKRT